MLCILSISVVFQSITVASKLQQAIIILLRELSGIYDFPTKKREMQARSIYLFKVQLGKW